MERISLGILLMFGCGAQRLVVGSRDSGANDAGRPPEIDAGASDAAPGIDPCLVPAASFTTATQPFSVVAADVNGDGKIDLVLSEGEVFLGGGDGSFLATSAAFANAPELHVADLDGDGKPDLAAIAYDNTGSTIGVELFRGNGDGTFQTQVIQPISEPLALLTIVDLDRDGHPDLALATANYLGDNGGRGGGHLLVLLGNGDGTFGAPVPYDTGAVSGPPGRGPAGQIASTDLNGDGNPDLVMDRDDTWMDVFIGIGDGTLKPAATWPTSNSGAAIAEAVAAADVDGDGNADVLVSTGTLAVLPGKGDGTFTGLVEYPTPGAVNILLGDVDGQPGLDVVFRSDWTSSLGVMFNDGHGGFGAPVMLGAPPPTFPPLSTVNGFALADFNGDHRPDLAVTETDDSGTRYAVQIYLNTCGGVPGPQ